jgi:anti-sigma-K factor RskA
MFYHERISGRMDVGTEGMSSDSDRYGRAGDYVMGRMGPAERERAERDLERDPKFREAVVRLAERLRRADVSADAALWQSVEAGLSDLPQMRAAATPRSREAAPQHVRRERRIGGSLGGWKGALLVAGVAAACGASYLAGDLTARGPTPAVMVALGDAEGAIGGILEVGPDDMLRFVPLDLGRAADGRVLRLWTLYDDGVGFVPLGNLDAAGALRWRGPDLPPPRAGQRYRITAEDDSIGLSGMPAGAPLFEGIARPVGAP